MQKVASPNYFFYGIVHNLQQSPIQIMKSQLSQTADSGVNSIYLHSIGKVDDVLEPA